jgi:hypothetical protein
MAAKLILAPEAEQDVSEAYDWYEKVGYAWAKSFSVPWRNRSRPISQSHKLNSAQTAP